MELFIFVRFEARPGSEDAVAEALGTVLGSTRAEPGCLSIHAFRGTRDSHLFFFHSRWRDEAAFDLHATLPHTRHFLEHVPELLECPPEITRTHLLS